MLYELVFRDSILMFIQNIVYFHLFLKNNDEETEIYELHMDRHTNYLGAQSVQGHF